MATPAPALLVLRAQVDARWPVRSRASDGIMGDAAHQQRKSAHNLGDAFDLTNDVAHGPDVGRLVEDLRRQMLTATAGRLELIIFARRIASRGHGWIWRPYGGPNPHDKHAHIEIQHSKRSITREWTIVG